MALSALTISIPLDYFGKTYPLEAIRGGDPAVNAQIAKDVLSGKEGACRDVVLINAGTGDCCRRKGERY